MLLKAMEDTDSSDSSISSSSSMVAAAFLLSVKPKPFSQGQLNDLVCDLGLSKESSEILASRLGEHGILKSGTKIIFHRDSNDLLICFLFVCGYPSSSSGWRYGMNGIRIHAVNLIGIRLGERWQPISNQS